MDDKDVQRFWSKVDKSGGEDACWEWQGYTADGYGSIKIDGKMTRVHRLSWILHNGVIPDGLCICHHCDNRKCCNPTHLFMGTRADNNYDMERKGRGRNLKGEKHGMAKLTLKQVKEIRKLHRKGYLNQADLAKRYGVNRTTIWEIIHRNNWR